MDSNFSEWYSSPQGFLSSWKGTQEKTSHSCQTEEVVQEEKSSQVVSTQSVEVQTTEDTELQIPAPKKSSEPYPPSLYAFFSKVTDPLCEYLKENEDTFCSKIFSDYNNSGLKNIHEAEATKLHTLRNSNVPPEFEGTCIAWSKTGSQIAVGYGMREHKGWCTHSTPISIWNINRTLNDKVPHSEIILTSCASALDFHPTDSTVLACGLHSGEIALIDLFAADRIKATATEADSSSGDHKHANQQTSTESRSANEVYVSEGSGHSLKVVSITWIALTPSQSKDIIKKNRNASNYCILSAGKDGFICLWSVNKANNQLMLEKKFVVWAETLPENFQVGNRTASGMQEIGINDLSTCKDDPTAFIFATFGGYIFQGNLLSEVQINDSESSNPILNGQGDSQSVFEPGSLCVSKQQSLVSSVDCSPYHRNLFLAATMDGRVILQNLLQPMKPTTELFLSGTIDVKWSKRPMMFAAIDNNKIAIVDLSLDKKKPSLLIQHDDLLIRIAFNCTDVGVIACCDAKGFLHIWKLPQSLSSHETKEMELLIDLGHPADQEIFSGGFPSS